MPADRSLVRLPSATARGSQGSRGGPRDNATYTKRLFLSARGYNATAHLRACIARDPRDLTHVEEVFVDGSASWTDSPCTVPFAYVRTVLELFSSCVKIEFRGVTLCSTRHPRLFPVLIGRLTSLRLKDCVVVTDGIDIVAVLAECPRLQAATFSNVVWIDGRSRYNSPMPAGWSSVTTLRFACVDASTVWRVGRALSAAACTLIRLHVGFQPSTSSRGKLF